MAYLRLEGLFRQRCAPGAIRSCGMSDSPPLAGAAMSFAPARNQTKSPAIRGAFLLAD